MMMMMMTTTNLLLYDKPRVADCWSSSSVVTVLPSSL